MYIQNISLDKITSYPYGYSGKTCIKIFKNDQWE